MEGGILQKIDSFFTKFKHQQYKKGEILVRADDNPTGIFYVKKGNVKEYAITRNGDEIIVNLFKPPAFFPMSWAINGTENNYFFEAMTDLEVWRIPKEEAVEFIKDNPDVMFNLLARVFKGTDGLLMRMTYLMSGNASSRLILELVIYAGRFAKGENYVKLMISEKDLAAQTGMTRETVSRQFKLLKEQGLIEINHNSIFIPNLSKLANELEI